MIEPFYLGGELETAEREAGQERVREVSEVGLERLLQEGRGLQAEMAGVPVEDRLAVLDMLGEVWRERLMAGELDRAKEALVASTGYPSKLIDLEFSLVAKVLDGREMGRNLSASLMGGARSLEAFVPWGEGESLRHLPAGPSLIISSGNSIVPTLIPTAVSLACGCFTLLKPSLSNYQAVVEAFSGLGEIMKRSPATHLMARSLCISYLGHDSPGLRAALTSSPFGVVNYWGGEPGRGTVATLVAQNPHRPRLFVNGPLTGFAIVAEGQDSDPVARGLALNMVLYEQQLCSSPTMGAYLGSWEGALGFAGLVREHLEAIGADYRVEPSDDALFVAHGARKVMAFKGSRVLSSKGAHNPWTLAVSPGRSNLDEAVASFPSFSLPGRRRFLELVVVEDVDQAARLVAQLPAMAAYRGVDKVQTVGLSLPDALREQALWSLAPLGVYRIVPIQDMFMRSAAEPYDGTPLASLFTYAVYERQRPLSPEGGP